MNVWEHQVFHRYAILGYLFTLVWVFDSQHSEGVMFFISLAVLSALAANGDAPPSAQTWEELSKKATELQNLDDFAGAELLRRQALEIAEKKPGIEDSKLAPLYSDLAVTLHLEARDAEADVVARQATACATRSSDPRLMGVTLNILGVVLSAEGENARAEPVLRRSVALLEQAEGPDSFEVAKAENNLAMLYLNDREYAKAGIEMARALPAYESLGTDNPELALILGNVFAVLASQHRAEEGEPYLRRALAIGEKAFPNSLKMANLQVCLAALENSRENYKDAARLLESAVATQERLLGPDHPTLAHTLQGYSAVLRHLHRNAQAKIAQNRANSILKSALPDVK